MKSFGRYGRETPRNDGRIPAVLTTEYQRKPAAWQIITPRKPTISLRHPLTGTALIAAIGIKPMRKPPVAEASTESPPRKPAKTGSPTAPTARYTTTDTAAYGNGRMKPQSATAKVCRVIGTPDGIGMEMSVHTAISAAKSAVNVIFSIDFFLFIDITSQKIIPRKRKNVNPILKSG